MKKYVGYVILFYLKILAKIQLAKNPGCIIIGITGSAGKTSTRKAIATILRTKGTVKESLHANSESGLPLNILGLTPTSYSWLDWLRLCLLAPYQLLTNWEHYSYYLAEMEADEAKFPKNMSYLLSILQPTIGVYVSAGVVHSQGFDSEIIDNNPLRRYTKLHDLIISENGRLLTALKPSGLAIYNSDIVGISRLLPKVVATKITVGKKPGCSLTIVESNQSEKGFVVTYKDNERTYTLRVPFLLESAYATTFGLALMVGQSQAVSVATGIIALQKSIIIPSGRMRVFAGENNTHLIDSTYNASPDTVLGALKLLKKIGKAKHKIAILGDMRELGSLSKSAHQQLAQLIPDYCDEVWLFGGETGRYTHPRLRNTTFPSRHFADIVSLISYAKTHVSSGSWVLVKGSQNTILLERVVEALLKDKNDVTRLCRRGVYWDNIRAKTK